LIYRSSKTKVIRYTETIYDLLYVFHGNIGHIHNLWDTSHSKLNDSGWSLRSSKVKSR
jgi:hypothetical protein